MKSLRINTSSRIQMLDITQKIREAVEKENIKEGIIYLYVPHTTAGITINENADPSVKKDILGKFREFVPEGDGYTHAEGNSDSHILASVTGNQVFMFIDGGKLAAGTWQGVYFCEFDGPRERQLLYKIVKDN